MNVQKHVNGERSRAPAVCGQLTVFPEDHQRYDECATPRHRCQVGLLPDELNRAQVQKRQRIEFAMVRGHNFSADPAGECEAAAVG